MNERRRYSRISIALPVELTLADGHRRRLLGTSSDVSTGGVYFVSDVPDVLKQGEQVGVRLVIPPALGRASTPTSLKADATVIRIEPASGEGVTGIACKFSHSPEFP